MKHEFSIWKAGDEVFAVFVDIISKPHVIHLTGDSPRVVYSISIYNLSWQFYDDYSIVKMAIGIYCRHIKPYLDHVIQDLNSMICIAKNKEIEFVQIYECDYDNRRKHPLIFTGNI